MLKVLLLSDFTSAYSRLLLKGFLRYSMEVGNWRFYRIPLSREDFNDEKAIETVIDIAQRWGADAIMGQLSEVNTERLRSIGIPVILQNYTNRVDGISNITGDYYGTGEMAANYFLRKGYTNFAFYGTSDTIWSREREEGFCTRLAEVGYLSSSLPHWIPVRVSYKFLGQLTDLEVIYNNRIVLVYKFTNRT